MLILPLNNEDHERRLRERGIYTEEQIARTLKRADMYVQHNQEHPGFFDMMICSGKSYSLPSVSPFCLLLFVFFFSFTFSLFFLLFIFFSSSSKFAFPLCSPLFCYLILFPLLISLFLFFFSLFFLLFLLFASYIFSSSPKFFFSLLHKCYLSIQ